MNKIRWGLFGAGILLDRWLKGFRQTEDAEIAGIASRTMETAQRALLKFRLFGKHPDIRSPKMGEQRPSPVRYPKTYPALKMKDTNLRSATYRNASDQDKQNLRSCQDPSQAKYSVNAMSCENNGE